MIDLLKNPSLIEIEIEGKRKCMKRILLITPYTPDNQGIGVSYTSQLLKRLADDFEIDLVYFRYKEDAAYNPVSPNIRVVMEEVIGLFDKVLGMLSLPHLFPLFTSRFKWEYVKRLNKLITKNHYDFVYLDFNQMFSYSLYLKHPRIILMAHDVIVQRFERRKSRLLPWIRWSERKVMKNNDAIVTFSDKDCQIIKQEFGYKSFPTNFFLNPKVIAANPVKDSDYFVFFGGWSRYDNYEALYWFLEKVIINLSDNFRYKIIGGGLPETVKAEVAKHTNMEYLGFVDDPYPIIANAKAEIAPLHYGAGVKVKCIEALGCGTPIIGTEVAFEGISERYKDLMILANTPEEYVRAIIDMDMPVKVKLEEKRKFIETYDHQAIIEYLKSH